jgi:isopentenyl-diphosphate delta-isomerase
MSVLVVVDENDKVIGSADYHLIHSKGLLHRFVSIFVLDANGRLYLQKRAGSKTHGNLLSESVSGHVKYGEEYFDTATRRLREELGLEDKLKEIFKLRVFTEDKRGNWTNNAFVKIFECTTTKEPAINKAEVQEGFFLPLNKVTTILRDDPESFVPGFSATFKAYLANR